MKRKLKAAILGFGSIGHAHADGYRDQPDCELVAVADNDPGQLQCSSAELNLGTTDSLDLSKLRRYGSFEELIASEELDIIDICVPTDFHAHYAIAALQHNINVLSEKPMAPNLREADAMIAAAEKSGKALMIGQCLRFWGEYAYLKKVTEDGRFGKLRNLYMERLSAPATWGFENWYMNYERAGGPITDLHIHDIDFLRYLLGEPEAVSCRADSKNTRYDACQTELYYKSGIPVTVVANEQLTGVRFQHGFRAVFDKACLIFCDNALKVYPSDGSGEPYVPDEIEPIQGIPAEIRYYVDLIENGKENLLNPPESAATSIRLVHTLMKSADKGGEIVKFEG